LTVVDVRRRRVALKMEYYVAGGVSALSGSITKRRKDHASADT
jgi:hypothetical protein